MAELNYPEKRQLAHSYLRASANHATASDDMGDDYFDAQERNMRDAAQKYPNVREHATVGADSDFTHKLGPGEREHQRGLREASGYSDRELSDRRKAIRGETDSPTPGRAGAGGGARGGSRRGGSSGSAVRTIAQGTGVPEAGSLVLQALGVGVGLALLYLLLNEKGKGPDAFSKLLGGVVGFMRALISASVDPLEPKHAVAKQTQGGEEDASHLPPNTTPAFSGAFDETAGAPLLPGLKAEAAASERQRVTRRLKPIFGPAPGIAGPLGLVSGGL